MGTGIINLARNVGASVGIATVTTMLERRTQFHMARLVGFLNNMNAAFRNTVNSLTGALMANGASHADASARAQAMVYSMTQRQAAMMAFVDNFKMLGVVFFAVIPVLLMMKKPKAPTGSVPVH
jgi:MFS transporter, DHA2 family, multidrug resistance protein